MSDEDGLVGVVTGPDRVRALWALLGDLTARYERAAPRETAALGRLVRDVRADYDEAVAAAVPEAKGTALDELTARRKAAGRADTQAGTGTGGGPKRRS